MLPAKLRAAKERTPGEVLTSKLGGKVLANQILSTTGWSENND